MRILLISSSARGHAIAEALARSPRHPEIFSLCTTKNPGIRRIAAAQEALDIMDFPAILAYAKRWRFDTAHRKQLDFAIIGPDDPIGAGLADLLEDEGIPCVAPRKNLAQIESSKGFARELLRKYGIDASPKYRIFLSEERKNMYNFIVRECGGNYVVKFDGLKGGKGVRVSGEHLRNPEEGVAYANECISTCGQVVIEEKLTGVEFSLMSFISGNQVVHMPAVQDHKRAFEGNIGANTGGMGSYSMPDHSLPFLSQADLERAKEINTLVAEALSQEGNPLPHPLSRCGRRGGYKGILYGGYMVTRDGVRVIEFNARFGDPEALNVLPLLESDFVDICQGIIEGNLTEDLVRFAHKATVCKYIVPRSYPAGKEERDEIVKLPTTCPGENVRIYYGDVTENSDGTLHLGTSRALGIVGIGTTIEEAEKIAQNLCEQVKGPVRFRSDIGTQIPYHMSFSR